MIYFTPGPSQLYPTVKEHINNALQEGFCSISHRSKRYEAVHQQAVENLKLLLNIPADYHVFFLSSATEIWDRCIENLIIEDSIHFVNGSFSEKFYTNLKLLGRTAISINAEPGKGFHDINEIRIPKKSELISITHNETSTGVVFDNNLITSLRKKYPEKLIAVDAVSSAPYGKINFTDVDNLYFSVQKGFGLPAGLGVWIVNNHCIEKAKLLQDLDLPIGTYHNLPSFLKFDANHQTPSTPNMLAIYLLAHVTADFLKLGLKQIETDTEEKASLLYTMIENSNYLDAFVKDKRDQSQTVIVANSKIPVKTINTYLKDFDMQIGGGYGPWKDQHIRIANFPAISKEHVEKLIDALNNLQH